MLGQPVKVLELSILHKNITTKRLTIVYYPQKDNGKDYVSFFRLRRVEIHVLTR